MGPANQEDVPRYSCSFQVGPRASNAKAMEKVEPTRIPNPQDSGARSARLPTFFLALGLFDHARLEPTLVGNRRQGSGWSVQPKGPIF